MIHPTAIISPKAELAADVEVGPYCVIGDGVELGEGCVLHNGVTLSGPSKIGKHNVFHSYACIGGKTQDLKYKGEPTFLEIGDRNTFREFTTVNRGTAPEAKTVIGSDNLFLTSIHIAHDCVIGNHVIFSNATLLAGHVMVEDYAIISGVVAIHQFCRVGRNSMIGGCSKIIQDVPPFMIVDGNPAEVRGVNLVGLSRHGFSDTAIRALKDAYKALFLKKVNLGEAVDRLTAAGNLSAEVAHLCDFIRSSTRGVTR